MSRLKMAIEGLGILLSSNRWHTVKYNNVEGYVYSEGLEIIGEEKAGIQKIIIQKARDLDLEPEIVLALADCESRFFPYTVSYDKDRPEIAFGVMQLTQILVADLNDKTKAFFSPVDDVFNLEQNIQGGATYLKWLYQERYKNNQDKLERSVAAYNAGPSKVPIDKPLDLRSQADETQRLVNCVKAHLRKRTFRKILNVFKKTTFALVILTIGIFTYEEFIGPGAEFLIQARILPLEQPIGQIFEMDSFIPGEKHYKLIDDLNGDGNVEKINFRYYHEEEWLRVSEIKYGGQIIKVDGGVSSGFTQDLDKDGIKEVIIRLGVGASGIVTRIYKLNDERFEYIPLEPDLLPEGFFGYVEFVDYDDDGNLEIRVNQRVYPPDPCKETADIYEYIDNQFILIEQIQTYEPTCREAMTEFKG